MLAPAAFNTVTGPRHFQLLAQARAIDSQSFVAPAPRIGSNCFLPFLRHSLAVSPMEKCWDSWTASRDSYHFVGFVSSG